MIPAKYRLPKRVKKLLSPTRHATPHLTLLVVPNQKDHARIRIIISKKVAPLAVRRNRIKRLITHQFDGSILDRSLDFVLIAKPSLRHQDDKIIIKETQKVLSAI